MTDTRRLSVEMRETLKQTPFPSRLFLKDALHDLDVAAGELAAAQATIQRQGAVIAEMWKTLASIADNSCCGPCQEAALVAKTALSRSTAQLAADHDAAVRADERRKVLEEAARVVVDASNKPEDDEVLQRVQDEIRALAAQPEEDK